MPTVLVVDDEPLIRTLLMLILEQDGYAVFSAENGAEALSIARRYGERIDLVVSDVLMPEMDGPTLASRLRIERPKLPVLLMSDAYAIEDLGLRKAYPFLPKPFDLTTFITVVRHMVERRPAPAVAAPTAA
jgi:two-component system cell cycle sensor histidine kinase/response regulator CckA